MMPSPYDLKYFLEVSSTLNLSRAAARLGISQPSLTLAIQRLEAALGAPVLIRGKRGVSLTQAGKQLLTHARALLDSWEAIRGKALASTESIVGTYSLGCHPSVALYSLAGWLPRALEEFPGLEIKLHHDLSRRVTDAVASMQLDIGIVVNPVRHPDLVIRKLCRDEVTLWASRKMPAEAADDPVLVCDPNLLQTQELIQRLSRGKARYRRILASSSLEVVAELTRAGAGVGVLPGRVARQVAGHQLKPVSGAPVLTDEICLVYRVENRGVRAIQAISERISRFFAESA